MLHRLVKKKTYEDEEVVRERLREQALLLEVLGRVNFLMSKVKDVDSFFLEIKRLLQEKLKFDNIHLWLRDESDPALLKLVTSETKGAARVTSIHRGVIGKTIREARTIVAPDVLQDADYVQMHSTTVSELCVPLMSDGHAIGAINIETDTFHSFENQLSIIQMIAENLSQVVRLALLYKTEEWFHHLVEHMSEGVWVGDDNERTLYTNPTLQKIVGYSLEELKSMRSYDLFDEESKKIVEKETERRRDGLSGHYEACLVSKSGEHIPVLVHAVPFFKGGTMGTITDIRPLKKTEQKLANVERYLAAIAQNCMEAIVGLDENGHIQSWNVGAKRMFGYESHEVVGKSPDILIPENYLHKGEPIAIFDEIKKKGFVRQFETVRVHKNGIPIHVILTYSAIKNDSGEVIGFSILYRDITAQKKWETELQDRFEKMQDAYRQMGRQRRELDYFIDMLNMSVGSSLSKKQIASFIVNAVVVISRVDGATLRLYDPSTKKLVLVAQSGLGEDWWSKKTIPFEGSLLAKAIKKGGPIKILDVLNEPDYPSPGLARKNNIRSALILPLVVREEVLGSLSLYITQEQELSILDDEFVPIFAKQAAITLKLAD